MMRLARRLIVLLVLVGGLVWISWLDTFRIKSVVVVGNSSMTNEEVETLASSTLDGAYLGIFSKRNALIYPQDRILASLKQNYPSIRDVRLETEGFGRLNIKIGERTPKAKWCSAIRCYFIDDRAYIYDEENEEGLALLGTTTLIEFKGNEENIGSEPVGVHALPEKLFEDLLTLSSELNLMNLPVEEIAVRKGEDIVVKTLSNGRIMFSARHPFQASLSNLQTSLNSHALAGGKQFEYVDVRYGNKVFYKLQGGAVVSTGSSTSATSTAHSTSTER